MSKQTYIILIIVGIFVVVGTFLYLQFYAGVSQSPDESSITLPLPRSDSSPDNNAPEIVLQTTEGTITVQNFLQNPLTVQDPVNLGHYFLGNSIDPSIDAPPQVPYVIEYNARTQYFGIALLEEPIGEARNSAEKFLMQYLGVTEAQLCQLKYMVSVPNRVNSLLAGVSLGFSFCPGSVQLE